jgi:hypothetical protein
MDDLWQPIRFDWEMIVKYDLPGPCYTFLSHRAVEHAPPYQT